MSVYEIDGSMNSMMVSHCTHQIADVQYDDVGGESFPYSGARRPLSRV
jgi:hypothetical protein